MCDAKLMTGLQAAGTLLSASGAVQTGEAQSNELQYRALQEKAAAGQEIAAASSRIADTELAGKMLESRMMAVAGASGVGMTSPTIVNLVSQAAGVTSLNQQMELYNAKSGAKGLLDQATADETTAVGAKRASRTRAYGTILSGATMAYNSLSTPGTK